jgi:plastocyanin
MDMRIWTIRRSSAVGVALAAAATLAACGGGGGGSSATTSGASAGAGASTAAATQPAAGAVATTRLAVAATESGGTLGFTRRALTSKAGDVTIALSNPSGNQMPHAVEITGGGIDRTSAVISPGNDATVTASLRPGRYTFFCPVDNHRQMGMEGTITVR